MSSSGRNIDKNSPSSTKSKIRKFKPSDSTLSIDQTASTKRTTITLALDEMIVKELRKESEYHRTSLNARINSILEKYTEFYRFAELLDSVTLPQKQFQAMLELMDEARVIKILRDDGSAAVLSVLNNMGIPATLENVIKFCYNKIIRWSGAYTSFNYYIDRDGYPCLVFEHKFGMKWSKIMAEAHSGTIEAVLQYPSERKVMPSTVVIRVMNRDTGLQES